MYQFCQKHLSKHLVKFYAWKLTPKWKMFGSNFENKASVHLSKIDCALQYYVFRFFEVMGCYPPVVFAQDQGKLCNGSRLHRKLNHQILKMVSHKDDSDKNESQEFPSLDTTLKSSNFQDGFENNVTFVKFYSPTCPNCQMFAPMWDQLVLNFVNHPNIKFSKVDCTKTHNKILCDEQEVPRISMYKNGKKITDYKGERTFDHLHTFVKQSVQFGTTANLENKTESSTNFARTVQSGVTIVKFYSPTCPHCQSFAPVWDQLASTYATKSNIKFSVIDCTEGELCEERGVDEVPTLHVYKNGRKIAEYTEGWSYGEVHSFVKQYLDS